MKWYILLLLAFCLLATCTHDFGVGVAHAATNPTIVHKGDTSMSLATACKKLEKDEPGSQAVTVCKENGL